MTELEQATALANAVLDKPYIDPDGDICLLARQMLRALERIEQRYIEANRILAKVRKVRDGYANQAKFADVDPASYFREFVRRLDEACNAPQPTAPKPSKPARAQA